MSKPHGSITQRPVPTPKKKFISPIPAKDPQKTEFEPPLSSVPPHRKTRARAHSNMKGTPTQIRKFVNTFVFM